MRRRVVGVQVLASSGLRTPHTWVYGVGLGFCVVETMLSVCTCESEVPVMGSRRRLTPEYRRDVAPLVLDTGSTIASVAQD